MGANIDARLTLLTWIVATVIALVVTVLFEPFHCGAAVA
jgi:hypothetical protein